MLVRCPKHDLVFETSSENSHMPDYVERTPGQPDKQVYPVHCHPDCPGHKAESATPPPAAGGAPAEPPAQ